MYCELTIRCNNSLPVNLEDEFGEWFTVKTDIDQVIANTNFDEKFKDLVLHCSSTPAQSLLLWQVDDIHFKSHIENEKNEESYSNLKTCIDKTRGSLRLFLKKIGNSEVEAETEIWNGDTQILSGRTKTKKEVFEEILDEKLVKSLVSGFVIYVLNYLFTEDAIKSLINVVAVAIVAVIWLLSPWLKMLLGSTPEISYEV